MTEQEYRQALVGAGFPEPVIVERDSAYALGVHEHPFEVFAFIADGEITLEVDNQRTTYRAGDTFRLPLRKPHLEAAGPQGVRILSGRKGEA